MGQYEDARDQARTAMINVARARQTISYGDLVGHIHTWKLDPHGETLAKILDDISTSEHQRGRGMLSAVVVHATDDYLPGPGFFKLASRLGHDASDAVAFHATELQRVHDAFASGTRRG
jgi:hypothetical protein